MGFNTFTMSRSQHSCEQANPIRTLAFATATSLGIFLASTPADANYVQTWGISPACLANAGACVAIVEDVASFYHNPAGGAEIDGTVVGGSLFFIDTRNAESTDSTGTHNPDSSSIDGEIAALPMLGMYTRVSPEAVIGIGVAIPMGIVADWEDAGSFRFNVLDQSLAAVDINPTIAWKPSENLRVGASINIAVAQQLGLGVGIPADILLPGGGSATSPLGGSVRLESDKDWEFSGLPPGSLDWGFHGVSVTAGLQYDVTDRLTVGAMGRTKQSMTWEGTATFDLSGVLAPPGLIIPLQSTRYSVKLDNPAFVQLGLHYKLIPNLLDVSFDWQRTFWSQADGWGKPLVIQFASPITLAGAPFTQLAINYNANDQNTWRFGATWHAMPGLDLRFGYAFDEAIFPNSSGDQITFDNDRHIFALGFSYDDRPGQTGSGWQFDGAFQVTHYEDKDVAAGQNANLGGLSSPAALGAPPTIGFTPNREAVTFGGQAYSLTLGASYHY